MALQRFEFPMSADGDDVKFECWGVVMPDGSVAVKLKELALFLGYENADRAYKLVFEEWKITWKNLTVKLPPYKWEHVAPPTTPANWHPETLFVLEPGVYALMARSNKPMAKEKMKFVYETILPTIRKTGKFEMSKTSDVINYDARMAEMKVELLEEKMKHQSTVACLAEKERAIVEIKLDHERQLAEFKKREYEMKLAMQRLSEAANMTMTQFAVNALLAKDNIAENEKMRGTLAEVSGRAVPALADRPDKEEYLTGYERTTNGKRKIRMCRSQLNEIQQQDKAAKRYRDEASRPATRSGPPPSIPKRYAWLKDSEKFLQLKCPNPVAVWLKVRMEQPHMFYGLRYTNKLKTEVEVLDERELREKYAKDAAMCERNKQIHSKRIDEFRALGLLSADDCVARCLTPGLEAKERIHAVAEDILNKLDADLAPSEPMKTHCNAGDVYTTEQLVKTMTNCQNYFVKNVFNFGTYNEAPREGGAPAIEQGVKSN
uniref:BRO-D n=1 Tax=Lymantria dispar multicapsid nuclear polyhedrosis virus TaxID=10449 RepID=A0A4P8NJ36_NPVLD|nr:BRO-D [Lymantria dispar multiple nucleopolyhedrovirus]QCQ67484.1 BRO-D [Lymantria dispar multiple nucleopolyhedrovirus]QCQ67643.1 BRO-D [Lymantria dispar multiple nucleopolyhedrovirus]